MKTVFFHGDRSKKKIAITFDDGPSRECWGILKVLKKEKVPATFFVIGKKIRKNGKILKQMIKQGCEIGNHTYNHARLLLKSQKKMEKEIVDTDNELKRLKIKTNLMRCPYFTCGIGALIAAKRLKKKIIFADIDGRDWMTSKKRLVKKVLRRVKNGSIICLHSYLEDIGHNRDIVKVTKKVIPKLKGMGYKLVTVSEVIKE